MRIFTFSELYGPFQCEADADCCRETFDVVLADEENAKLPEQNGSKAANYITANKIGIATCMIHLGVEE